VLLGEVERMGGEERRAGGESCWSVVDTALSLSRYKSNF